MKKNTIIIIAASLALIGCGPTNGSKETKQNDHETDLILKKAHYYLTYSDEDVNRYFVISEDTFIFKGSAIRSELYEEDNLTNLIASFTYDLYSKEGKGKTMYTFFDTGMVETAFSFVYDFSKKSSDKGFYGEFFSFDLTYPEKWPASHNNNYASLFLADTVKDTIQEKCLNVIDNIAKTHDFLPA